MFNDVLLDLAFFEQQNLHSKLKDDFGIKLSVDLHVFLVVML